MYVRLSVNSPTIDRKVLKMYKNKFIRIAYNNSFPGCMVFVSFNHYFLVDKLSSFSRFIVIVAELLIRIGLHKYIVYLFCF